MIFRERIFKGINLFWLKSKKKKIKLDFKKIRITLKLELIFKLKNKNKLVFMQTDYLLDFCLSAVFILAKRARN